jgi:hypothetical protein
VPCLAGAPDAPATRVLTGAALILAALGASAAVWQHVVAASASNLTLADKVINGAARGLDRAVALEVLPVRRCGGVDASACRTNTGRWRCSWCWRPCCACLLTQRRAGCLAVVGRMLRKRVAALMEGTLRR